jgi:hypothetical protein
MPIEKITRGTGITKRTAYRVKVGRDGKFDTKDIDAIRNGLFEKGRDLESRLAEIERIAVAILANAGLPTKVGLYQFDATGKWSSGKKGSGGTRHASNRTCRYPLSGSWTRPHAVTHGATSIADARGFACDSFEGYAARAIDRIQAIRQDLTACDMEEACVNCFRLGSLVTEAELKDRGDGPSKGGIKGAQKKWGWGSKDRNNRCDRIRQAFVVARASGVGKIEAYELAARKQRVSVSTVRRAVSGKIAQ